MIDRKKVIKGLECCGGTGMCFHGCPYHEVSQSVEGCTSQLAADALELLKEQKADLEDLEKKYIALLNERISELMEENAKLNAEMNQAISERLIHTVDKGVKWE